MAKATRAASTRIATTVTARYYPTSGATDGFYLDGRVSGRREHRAADITLDREERGFFYSVYAHLSGSGADEGTSGPVRKALDRIMTDVKQPGHNIDTEINELAECAVSVVGRITLKHDGMRQPYFAGILVRDAELAAVTMGNGCAYLYRGDILYPLTADDFSLDPIDFAGKQISGLDVYCAGVAGTVRYSNIAQLQLDDCLIVCNRDVMESLGQREVLRMLYEADDQADAAGMIITAAAAKMPGTPMQFMIGFVESISSIDRTGRVILPRSQADTAAVPVVAAAVTSRDHLPLAGKAVLPSQEDMKPEPAAVIMPHKSPDQPRTTPRTQPVPVKSATRDLGGRDAFDEEDSFGDEIDTYGRGRRIAFYIIIAAICIGCLFLIYNMLFGGQKETTTTTTTVSTSGQTTALTTGTEPTDTEPSQTDPTATGTEPTATTTPTTAPTTTSSSGYQIQAQHTVVAGDTLWGIAKKYYGTGTQEYIDLIKAANNMTQDIIKVGMVLDIPVKP
jgi:LysM repeat protein